VWEGLGGRVDKEKVEKFLPPPGETTKILVCGPIVMTNGVNLMLHDMGYEEHMIFFVFVRPSIKPYYSTLKIWDVTSQSELCQQPHQKIKM